MSIRRAEFGWNLPPGVTPEMIDEMMTERVYCNCEVEVTNKDEINCKECGEWICTSCEQDNHGYCNHCS